MPRVGSGPNGRRSCGHGKGAIRRPLVPPPFSALDPAFVLKRRVGIKKSELTA